MTHEKDLYNSRKFKLSDCIADIKKSTLSRDTVNDIKQRFYIDTVRAVMHESYKGNNSFDAFSQNIFYIADLQSGNFITEDEADDLITSNAVFFIEAEDKENKKKGSD